MRLAQKQTKYIDLLKLCILFKVFLYISFEKLTFELGCADLTMEIIY